MQRARREERRAALEQREPLVGPEQPGYQYCLNRQHPQAPQDAQPQRTPGQASAVTQSRREHLPEDRRETPFGRTAEEGLRSPAIPSRTLPQVQAATRGRLAGQHAGPHSVATAPNRSPDDRWARREGPYGAWPSDRRRLRRTTPETHRPAAPPSTHHGPPRTPCMCEAPGGDQSPPPADAPWQQDQPGHRARRPDTHSCHRIGTAEGRHRAPQPTRSQL